MHGMQPASTGDVLVLALEDNQRRLQKRCDKLRGAHKAPWSERIKLVTQWRRLDKGGLQDIISWCDEVKEPRLIVIDTLQKVKPIRPNAGYAEDYEALADLQTLANARSLAVLVLHHTRKAEAEDPLDRVSGTLGLTGSADTTLVLDRSSQGVTLYGRGRDIEEFEHAMLFEKPTCRWRILGDAAEVQRSETAKKIMDALKKADRAMSPREIAEDTGLSEMVVRGRLPAMIERGEAQKVRRGHYAHNDYVV
jgi:RecA-family ATPase